MSAPSTTATLVELLRSRATQQPDQLAYTFLHDGTSGAVAQSYRELDRRARTIGAALQRMEAAGSRALLLYPPGLDYLAAFIGCLYAGVVAVPAYPPQLNRPMPRLQAIAQDSQATIALTTTHILNNVESRLETTPQLQRLHWFATDQLSDDLADHWQQPDLGADDLAFLQYTSGSTATPKGVMLSHRNLLSNLGLIQQGFGATSDSRGVIWLPPYHDMGLIGGILQPLYSGFPVTLMSPVHFLQRPIRWLQAISDTQGTISGGPNFAYELCLSKITPEQRAGLDLSSWHVAFNGAEPIRAETIERFTAMFAPCGFRREAFYPCYGLAEATLMVSGGVHNEAPIVRTFQSAPLAQNQVVPAPGSAEQEDRRLVSCGRQLASSQALAIVDPATGVHCRPDQVGEIWLAGPSIARGYWNQPSVTAEVFQAHLAETGAGPFLRTGDLGFVHDGELFVTGRLKDLIIIRGRNYYPHDIERTVEQCHPALRVNAGAVFSVDVEHEERLVVVQEIDRRHRDVPIAEVAGAIRRAVAEEHNLQVYAVALIKTGSLPKTSSGKIQRRACRAQFLSNTLELIGPPVLAPSSAEEAAAALDEPDSLLEADLQRLVAQVLKLAPGQVERHTPLTALGLDSLQAVELQHSLETQLRIQLPLTDLVSGATLAEIATTIQDQLDAGLSTLPALRAAGEPTLVAPLSHGQRALWFVYQVAPESSAYNVANAARLLMELDVAALRGAFQLLLERHPALRSTFRVVEGEPVQQIQEHGDLWFQHEDASQWSEQELQQRLEAEAERPFDLERGPVLRVQLFTRSAHEHILLAVAHHIVVDLWSFSVLIKDLDALYHALTTGTPVALEPLPLAYADYVNMQQALLAGPAGDRLWRYWQQQLAGDLPTLDLPTDRPRPPLQTYRGATEHGLISAQVAQGLKALSARHNTTLFTTLLAAFQVLLYRYSGQSEILVGSPSAGRTRADLAGVTGYFVNPLVLRADCGGNPAFTTFLEQVRQTVLAAFTHQDYPFTLLAERLQPSRDASRSPLFQAMFVLQKAPLLHQEGLTALALGGAGSQLDLTALQLQSVALERRAAQFDLSLIMVEVEGRLEARFEYNSDLFDGTTISRMVAHFQLVLAQIVAAPDQPIATMPLVTTAEQQLVSSWNATRQTYQAACIHHRFAAQAARTPDASAVIFQEQRLSYRELDIAANRLAHYLRDLGVGMETPVGIAVERSPELLIGLLGILKAGAAYVPLDPSYPAERLRFMLDDSGARVLLTQARLQSRLPQHSAVVCLDADPKLATYPATAPDSRVTPDHLAYVIYTSGSTGQPKGVQIDHQSVINLVGWHQRTFAVTAADRASQLAGLAFDASVWEIWPYLLAGATLVLPDDETRSLPERLQAWLCDQAITISFVPTPIAEQLIAAPWPDSSRLRFLLTGGDRLQRHPSAPLPFRLVNNYGPTECTVVATSGTVPDSATTTPPAIGRPIDNTAVLILGPHMEPVPLGVAGDLYIASAGLARGYLKRPDLTAERFIPNPFASEPGARLYHTGDRARYRADGQIEFLGRADAQVKLRGFRIELGEIEAALMQHPAIRDALVLARTDSGETRLVAYVVEEQGNKGTKEQTIDNEEITFSPSPAATEAEASRGSGQGGAGDAGLPSELRAFLRRRLPEYMIPSAFVTLPEFPLTPNGKLDRKALPVPDRSQDQSAEQIAPRTATEARLAEIWRELLEIEQVGVHDNFFDRGGHSLLGAQLVSRVRKAFGVELPLSSFIEQPNIASLAAVIDQHQNSQATRAPEKIQSIPRRGRTIGRVAAQIDQLSESEVKQLLEEKRLARKRDSHE